MGVGEIGLGGVDWIDLTQDRDQWRTLVNAEINRRIPLNVWNFLTGSLTGSCSGRSQLQRYGNAYSCFMKGGEFFS
jgi:hypothetical protein